MTPERELAYLAIFGGILAAFGSVIAIFLVWTLAERPQGRLVGGYRRTR